MLEAIDPEPRMFAVDVTLVDLAKGVELDSLSGPADKVAARLRELKKSGQVTDTRRINVTAHEGREVMTQSGASRPHVTSGTATLGVATRSISYVDEGSQLNLTVKRAGASLAVDLTLTDRRAVFDKPAEGEEPGAPGFLSSELAARLKVKPGTSVAANANRDGGPDGTATAVIITVRPAGPGA